MPAEKVKGLLGKKLGVAIDQSVKAHAKDETKAGGFRNLPGGIRNGVARLRECYFGEVKDGPNKGAVFFRAAGTVLEPETVVVDGSPMRVAGLQTSIMVVLADQKDQQGNVVKTQDEFVGDVLNHLRLLGGDEFTASASSGSDLEALAETLEKVRPYFAFATSVGKPQIDQATGKPKVDPKTGKPYEPRVWENWYGSSGFENYKPPAPSGVEDSGEPTARPAPKASSNGSAPPPAKSAPPTDEYRDDGDLDSLVGRAKSQDKEAQRTLSEMAVKAGYSPEEVDDAPDWDAVRGMVDLPRGAGTESGADGGGGGTDGDDEFIPERGKVYGYRPLTKDGTPGKRSVKCEVTKVSAKKQTVALKSLADGKTVYDDIPWGDLEQ